MSIVSGDVRGQRGFSMIELMVSLTVLIIGIVGVLGLQRAAVRGSAYARHATEAAVLAEDKMEELRTLSNATIADGTETVDAQGVVDPDGDGFYRRVWQVVDDGTLKHITVTVGWQEGGGDDEPHLIMIRTQRPM